LFQAASADLSGTSQWLEALAAVAASDELQAFADNPKVTDQQVYDLIAGVAKGATETAAAQNFLRTVIENGRLSALPEIHAQFRALVNAQRGSSDAVVYSAFPIDAAQTEAIVSTLAARFGRKIKASVSVDSDLIGGVSIRIGDEVIDASVRGKLAQMAGALAA